MKTCFMTEKGPKAMGPYSSAVIHENTVYLSGIVPTDPETGGLVQGGIEQQAHRVLKNIRIVLGELGLDMTSALKVTVFLRDMNDFSAMNAIYAEYFGPCYPARSCFQVARLPLDAAIEIEVIAALT
jgi:2-iminobutanoate/2-iminopropanoate deaminase